MKTASDERKMAVHNEIVQLRNSYRGMQANGSQPWSLRNIFCSLPGVFYQFFSIYSFFFWMSLSVSLSHFRSPPSFPVSPPLLWVTDTQGKMCVCRCVYRQDVTAIRSNPICFQIRGAQRTERQDREKKKKHIFQASTAQHTLLFSCT